MVFDFEALFRSVLMKRFFAFVLNEMANLEKVFNAC